ncbi:MAG: hypothetical protein WBB85_23045 [Albidovulum sp.]|uniref:hypothetical protein n=1 Tax=Albidovulum sp. TaxID=1872424 RepID=UPI003CBC5483
MINWLLGGNAVQHPVGIGIPGHIRIAFPAFGDVADKAEIRPTPQKSVSREEIAKLFQYELGPVES